MSDEGFVCKQCGSVNAKVELTPQLTHHAKESCADCGRFSRWLQKPDNERERRPAGHRNLVKKFGEGFCEFCGRKDTELPPGEVLIGHHIREFSDDGDASENNVLILCTNCHALCHHQRTYLGHYHLPRHQGAA